MTTPGSVMVASAPGELTFPALPAALDTPRVVIDLARVDANIARLQAAMDARGVAVRPHAIVPNHVCPVIDLVDDVAVVGADGSLETWPIDARGCSG